MNDELRNELAKCFFTDSDDYLKRYEILKENLTHIGNRSKLAVDLLFSFECSLKALIFLESRKDEKSTYKAIKSHDIKELLKFIDDSPIINIATFIQSLPKSFSVVIRYSLEAHNAFRENGALSQKYHSTIANFVWIEDMYNKAKELHDYVGSKIAIEETSLSSINIKETLDNISRLKNISSK